MSLCWRCKEGHIVLDPNSGAHACDSCGIVHDDVDFQAETFDSDGRPLGSLVHSVGEFGYRERKIRDAKTIISDLTTLQLGLSATRSDEIAAMVSAVTDGTYGVGEWFSVLVGACSYLVMRRHRIPLPIAEVAAAIGRDAREVGRMAGRVTRHLDLELLPEFDAVQSLVRAVGSCPSLNGLGKEKKDEIIGQGRFLLQCAVRWSLTTGRHPLPMIAAVVVFVTEVNGVAVGLEEIAKEIYANVSTSKLRLRELKDTLIKVARVLLPWGADVTAKNLVQNAPLLIRFMELKSKNNLKYGDPEGFEFNVDGLMGDEEDAKYFKVGGGDDDVLDMSGDGLCGVKLSVESLSLAYKNVLERLAQIKESGGLGKGLGKKSKRWCFDFDEFKDQWQWEDRWHTDKGLTFKQVLQKDVGYDALPPSFVFGVEARRGRRMRVEDAKCRINKIMKPSSADATRLKSSVTKSLVGKKRRRGGVREDSIDWEDCIIELLLLHGVAENEIEQGQYRRLLDLHIFNCSST